MRSLSLCLSLLFAFSAFTTPDFFLVIVDDEHDFDVGNISHEIQLKAQENLKQLLGVLNNTDYFSNYESTDSYSSYSDFESEPNTVNKLQVDEIPQDRKMQKPNTLSWQIFPLDKSEIYISQVIRKNDTATYRQIRAKLENGRNIQIKVPKGLIVMEEHADKFRKLFEKPNSFSQNKADSQKVIIFLKPSGDFICPGPEQEEHWHHYCCYSRNPRVFSDTEEHYFTRELTPLEEEAMLISFAN